MKVTCEPKSISLTAAQNSNRLATASIVLDDAFVVRNLSVMNGPNGLFVSMPSQKGKDKEGNVKYYDTAFPLIADLRSAINEAVLDSYAEKLNELQNNAAKRDYSQQNPGSTSAEEPEEDDVNEMY